MCQRFTVHWIIEANSTQNRSCTKVYMGLIKANLTASLSLIHQYTLLHVKIVDIFIAGKIQLNWSVCRVKSLAIFSNKRRNDQELCFFAGRVKNALINMIVSDIFGHIKHNLRA